MAKLTRLGTSSPLSHTCAADWAANQKALGLGAVNFHLNCEDDSALVDEYVRAAQENDLMIAEVGVWKNTLDPDPAARKKAMDFAVGQLALADRIGAGCCVNILGARGPRWDGAYKENFTSDTWKLGVKTIQEIIDSVNPKNTYFTIESMPWMYPMGPDEYQRLLWDVNRDRFAVHMDVFNWMTNPKRYFMNEDFIGECFEKLGRYIKSCHLKDVRMEEDYTVFLRETYAGNGGINIRYLIETALSCNSDMPFIIEHLNTDEEYIRSVRYIQSLMNL